MKKFSMPQRDSLNEAKAHLLANIGSNIVAVFVNALIAVWLTSYLVHRLGVEVYGVISLVVSFIAYFELCTRSITSTVSRYVAVSLNSKKIEISSTYFSTAFFALVILCGVLLVPVIILSVTFARLFNIPEGFEAESGWLVFLVMLSSFINAISSPFLVSTFVTHRFYLSNLVKILGLLLRAGVIVLCFAWLGAALQYVGLSYCAMALFGLIGAVVQTRFLTPELHVKPGLFRWNAFREMTVMNTWVTINQVGSLLYLSVSFMVINIFLGSEQCGRYGTIVLWVTLLDLLGGAVGDVFSPIAFDYIARGRIDIMAFQMRRSTKFLCLIMGLPVGLLCGLSVPILKCWLGPSFADLGPLAWLLVGPWIVNVAVRPMFSIFRGLDRVKIPAIATVIGGVVNVVLSILLIRYTNMGIYGVALALSLSLVVKNPFFTTIYAAIITNQPKMIFIREIMPGVAMTVATSLLVFGLSRICNLASIPKLLLVSSVVILVYGLVYLGVFMKKEDRLFFMSLIMRER